MSSVTAVNVDSVQSLWVGLEASFRQWCTYILMTYLCVW